MGRLYLDMHRLKPGYELYAIKPDVLEKVFQGVIHMETGLSVGLRVDCFGGEKHDVFVCLSQEQEKAYEKLPDDEFHGILETLSDFGFYPDEHFLSRVTLFEKVFGSCGVEMDFDSKEILVTVEKKPESADTQP